MLNPFLQAFSEVITLFEQIENEFGFKYILVGGVLTPIYAESRQTLDIDIVAQLQISEENQKHLIDILEKHQFYPIISWEDTFFEWKTSKYIQFLDKTESIKIDLSIMEPSNKERSVYEIMKKLSFENRKRISIQNIDCWATSKEDFILSKLVYGGYQDYKDALACWIRYASDLDKTYLEENARNLQVEQEFHYLVEKVTASEVFSDD
jgi:hypothetical protein